jgi:hypothetical protein
LTSRLMSILRVSLLSLGLFRVSVNHVFHPVPFVSSGLTKEHFFGVGQTHDQGSVTLDLFVGDVHPRFHSSGVGEQ